MRKSLPILCLLLSVCALPALAAQKQKLTPEEEKEAAKQAKIDEVARQAFTAADRNHNDVLSKTEFPDAAELLEEGFVTLGQQGILGQVPQSKGVNTNEASARKALAAAPANLYKKNRVSMSEFQLYAKAMAVQADVQIAEANAQKQAYAQYLQHMRSRGRGRTVRSGTPIFLGP